MTAVLYIIMRNDLVSMNPGKAIAQGSHASNAFVHQYHEAARSWASLGKNEWVEQTNSAFTEWENSTRQGFGTVLVLEGSMRDIAPRIDLARGMGYIASVVHDPTYPIVDGAVVHHIPLDTCAFVFVPNKETDNRVVPILAQFSLHH